MTQNKKSWNWSAFLLIGVLLGTFIGYGLGELKHSATGQEFTAELEVRKVINFMQNNDIEIWGTETCPWCQKQREEFGDLFDFVLKAELYHDCSERMANCINGVPAWTQNEARLIEGYLPIDKIIPTLEERIR